MAQKPFDGAFFYIAFFPRRSEPMLQWAVSAEISVTQTNRFDMRQASREGGPYTIQGTNLIRERSYGRPIRLIRIPNVDKDEINRSVGSIMPSIVPNTWRGAMAASVVPQNEDHIDLRLLRELSDFFTSRAASCKNFPLQTLRDSIRKVKGVRINCPADMMEYDMEQYVPVEVCNGHPIHLESEPCDIPRLVRIPIKMYRYTRKSDQPAPRNEAASSLHRSADVNSKTWGFPSQRWTSTVASVLVVRCDGKDLLTEHLDALCFFCEHHFADIFSLQAEAELTEPETRTIASKDFGTERVQAISSCSTNYIAAWRSGIMFHRRMTYRRTNHCRVHTVIPFHFLGQALGQVRLGKASNNTL